MYLEASVHHFTVCVASFPCLQNVRTPGSEFAYRCAHFTVRFVFIDHKLCVRKAVRQFQAMFCAYASFINETPELCREKERTPRFCA